MNKTIPAYIINLPTSMARREYMTSLMSEFAFLRLLFVPAINGREMSELERDERFDYARSFKHYGRRLNGGEVGCALSHRKCYSTLLESSEQYTLILEDDISVIRNLNELPFENIDSILRSDEPRVLFLSGDYWRMSAKPVTRVFDAVGGYAYFINRAAAKAILQIGKPFTVADDWMTYKRIGVKLYAVFPYAVDANLEMDKLSSDVKQYSWTSDRSEMDIMEIIRRFIPGIIRRIMKGIGLFESKIRVIDNKPVDR